ncbi:MAG: c-type cytochrome [Ramlibacter sp.]|nr:c-type cytochrome [Ramlibacter sp.]
MSFRRAVAALPVLLALALSACGGGGGDEVGVADVRSETAGRPEADAARVAGSTLSPAAELGKLIFHDASLSASGQMSCATCHAPELGHASPFATPVAMGGARLDRPGVRTSPTLRYLRFSGAFDDAGGARPFGGFFWDGRAATLKAQARGPLLNPDEMANRNVADVVAKLAAASYAPRFREVFGADIMSDPQLAFRRMTLSLQRYQLEAPEFAPFTSKFDAVNAGRATFTPQEANGLALFNRADKGNCAQCHSSTKPANAPGALRGLCGDTRTDLADRTDLCGSFKVPTLRNVALRKHFFHNGVFETLEQVIRFYARRDSHPEQFYPLDANGNPVVFNDLPRALRGNVTTQAPFGRTAAQGPALTHSEVADVAAFLRTLTDGYVP